MEGRFSDQPYREHGNLLKPVRTRDDVGKNLANAIVAGFRWISLALRERPSSIPSILWRHDKNNKHIKVCLHEHRILDALG